MVRNALKTILVLLPMLALVGCAELTTLRERTAIQDKTIARLQKENSEFQTNYYKIKEMLDSENAQSQKSVGQLQYELDQARNLKTKQEKELSDQLRTRNLEYEALKSEAADQKTQLDTQIGQLQRNVQTLTAERDAALTRLKDSDDKLRAEQARTTDLTKQLAALKVDVQTLNDRVAGLQKDTTAKDQALQAEKDARQKTEQARADLEQKLKAAQDEGSQLKKQLAEASAKGESLAQVQKEKDALAAELDNLKKKTAKDLETAKAQVSRASTGAAEDPELKDTASQFAQKLKDLPEGKGIQTKVDRRGLRIIIPSSLLFDENATVLADRASGVLTSVAGLLKQVPGRTVRVEGHTDNQAVQDLPFADNWGLGFARADRVREFLMKDGGVSGSRLEALSRAQFEPLTTNDTAEGRKQNRRVEIVIGAK